MITLTHFIKWKFGLAQATTQTTDAERDCLADFAHNKSCVVEIGVWHAVTTCRLLRAMSSSGVLYAIDPYPSGRLLISFQRQIAMREAKPFDKGRIRWVRKTGVDAARQLTESLRGKVDFIFIDGDHSYEGIKGDWEGWSNLLSLDGIIALHDSRVTPTKPIHDAGSVRFTQGVIRKDPRFVVASEIDSLTVLRRIAL